MSSASKHLITYDEVAKHASRKDCWCVIHGKVYDLGPFLAEHPGGAQVILKYAGKDATSGFDPIHPQSIIDEHLPKGLYIGDVDPSSTPTIVSAQAREEKVEKKGKPPLSSMFNSFDFESVARSVLSAEAWAYYSSGADDELTLQENHMALHRIWLRPRILVNVRNIDTSTTLLGTKTSLPIYISATALGKLGHPEGEVVLTRAAASRNIIQMMPTLASCSLAEMTAARAPGQTQWFQLYVNSDRRVTGTLVKRAETLGAKALFITVDAPQLGRREKDMRTKFVDDAPDVQDEGTVDRNKGAARAISAFIDPSLSWDDIPWFKSITKLPIMLKGVQSGQDAVRAAKAGVAGMVISNHGGRQLDTARSSVEVLEEVMEALRKAKLQDSVEVFVDGGFRRATDIFKALALGAKAVGLGRPFLYSMSAYGQAGVERLVDLLKDELEMVMRLMGTPDLASISGDMVLTKSLAAHGGQAPKDALSRQVYDPLITPLTHKL